jgi:hypothetical protein
VPRIVEGPLQRPRFDDAPRLHHSDAVTYMPDDAEIERPERTLLDEQHRMTGGRQLFEQRQDLLLKVTSRALVGSSAISSRERGASTSAHKAHAAF